MRRWFKPNFILISTSILGLGVYLMILFQLPRLQTELRYGLRFRLEEIATKQTNAFHLKLSQHIDLQWANMRGNNSSLAPIVRDAGQLLPGQASPEWQMHSFEPKQGIDVDIEVRLSKQIGTLLSPYNDSTGKESSFWRSRLDSCLYISIQKNPLQKALLYVCKPVFQNGKLHHFWYLQIDRRYLERVFLIVFFRDEALSVLSPEELPWGEQINLQWRDEKGKMVFNYPALAKGQMERRLSKVESKPILKLYRIEAGWLGQTSKEIAASVYRRNLWVLHGMLILFALLMLYAYRTQQKAARLEHLKTDFISQMSHELKTPLATIKLAAETLQKGRFQTLDEASQSGDLIHQQSQILAKRINRLFEFSRSAEGQHIPDHSDLPIEKIWQRLQQQASNMALSWQRKLEIQGEAFGEASLSEEAIWSIVEILLENAFQYSPTDQVVSFSSQVHSRFWQLSVSDQGPGIAKEQQELIFEKFVRLDSSDTQSHGGYGMGLTIARQLATKMNGQILLQSTVGQGSRFTLQIPLSA